MSVSRRANRPAWEKFFEQLDGEPTFITCDRDEAMLNAIASTWPDAKVYPCVSHLRVEAMVKLRRWIDSNADAVARSLVEAHWPVGVGAIERPLRDIKNTIYDRRANLKNMQRVGHLLVLAQLRQMGYADEREWAVLLRENHLAHHGTPPPRRQVDDPALRTR